MSINACDTRTHVEDSIANLYGTQNNGLTTINEFDSDVIANIGNDNNSSNNINDDNNSNSNNNNSNNNNDNDDADNNDDDNNMDISTPNEMTSPNINEFPYLQPDTLTPVISKSNKTSDISDKVEIKSIQPPFPNSRVKTLMKADPDTHLIQSEAIIIVNEAAKFFLSDFVREVQQVTLKNKRKIITKNDIDSCIRLNDKFIFLEDQLNW